MKRGLTIVIVVLVIVAVGVGLLWYVGSKSLTDQTNNALGFIKITQKDTDQDGLSDPEEALWGTDINNPDTNNDGIADGNSIQKNIDPAKEGGAPISGADGRIQALVQNAMTKKGGPLINSDPSEIPATITLKESDLNITNTETVATITKFRTDIQKVGPYLEKLTGKESALLNEFVETGNQSLLLALNTEKQNYLDMLKAFLEITVPQSAVESYLIMLNDLARVTETVDYMSQVTTEPLFALKNSQILGARRASFLLNFVTINNYFVERGI